MKKIFGALSLAVLFLSGCIKGDDTFEKMEPVIPGINMYTVASSQNLIALQPSNAGMRFAILLAEAVKQGETDLTNVLDADKKSVLTQLFDSKTKIEKTTEEGDYKITFSPDPQLYESYVKGSLLVKTGGLLLAETTAASAWRVEPMDDFRLVQSGSNGTQLIVEYPSGGTALYANGDGSFSIVLDHVATNIKDSSLVSDWSGSYRIRPDATSLAYSDCHEKDFTVAGNMGGASMHSLAVPSDVTTDMSINLSNVKYKYGGRMQTGTFTVRLTGIGDYDASVFVSPTVTMIFALDANNRYLQTVEYNGHTVNLF